MNLTKITKLVPIILVSFISTLSLILSIIASRLSTDSGDWGLQYASAIDIINGLSPYSESFNGYGILASLIHAAGLVLFGNNLVSLGIMTGVFYSLSLLLSYFLFNSFINQWLSCISVLLMFLIHEYIVYIWPNYIAYPFLLGSLLLITSPKPRKIYFLLSGFLIGCSLLSRNTYFISILPAIYIYFFILAKSKRSLLKRENFLFFNLGLSIPLLIFFGYLILNSSTSDWYEQTFLVFARPSYSLIELAKKIIVNLWGTNLGLKIYSFIFVNNLVILSLKICSLQKSENNFRKDSSITLAALISIFGYIQSLHIYEIFRLQTISALGIGILLYTLSKLAKLFKPQLRILLLMIPIIYLIISLSLKFQFVLTSSVPRPVRLELLLTNRLREPQNIEILKNKLFSEEKARLYEDISHTLSLYSCQIDYLVNLTRNSLIPYLSKDYERLKLAPWSVQGQSQHFKESEKQRYEKALENGQALLIAYTGSTRSPFWEPRTKIPENYKIVSSIKYHSRRDPEGKINIAIPQNITNVCPN